ncbi:Fasciclin-1 [Fasciola gigantica]|uniref:Fasciclin-1 n=1 Tax=Fasciola gigantica TaxID=46835 RepID=A0A504YZR7_FASGI|nr:Fasciclin-1 [Fasciola gigantica]
MFRPHWSSSIIVLLLIHQGFDLCVAQQTLWDLLQKNPNTTKFADYVREVQMTNQFQDPACAGTTADCITLFAPNNGAVDASATVFNWATLNPAQKMLFVSSHMARETTPLKTENWNQLGQAMNLIDIGFGTGRLYRALSTQCYMFQSKPIPPIGPNNLYYVGNALVVEPNLVASNGVMQVMDNVQYTPEGDTNFLTYLTKQADLSTSAQLWTYLASDPRYKPLVAQRWMDKDLYSTFFIVTNDGWAQVPSEQLTRLRSNITLLASVLANHYLPNQILYSEWTPRQYQVNFYTGFPTDPSNVNPTQLNRAAIRRVLDGKIVVTLGGSDATVQGPSVQIKQAIVHRIPAPLGFVYETRDQVLSRLNSQLLTACQADTACRMLLTNEVQLTVFSPSLNVMTRFNGLTTYQKTLVLKYLFIPGLLVQSQMTDLKVIAVGNVSDAIRFRVDGQNLFYDTRAANSGYVPSRIMVWDQMSTNGVVHTIDGIPCNPAEKIEDYLSRNGQFSKYNAYQFVQSLKLGGPYTICAPTNNALMAMEASTTVGLPLLQDKARREYIFRRHAFPRSIILQDLQLKPYDAATANYAFTREEVRLTVATALDGRIATLNFQGQTAEITTATGGFEFTNGWLYTIERLMYTANDLTSSMCNQRGCP